MSVTPLPRRLSGRQLARLARVSRSFPSDLQKSGLLHTGTYDDHDVLVVRALSHLPGRWTRHLHELPDDVSLSPADVATLLRRHLHADTVNVDDVLVLEPTGARLLPQLQAAAAAALAADAVLCLPVGRWKQQLSDGVPADAPAAKEAPGLVS